ncbi:MAG: apolipoprotein N-acyltransferase [Alphaproteobacteria bacterium]|nr:apolipoprotein N-acyltransferase [Alphaproteobacteria bacterium]
MVAKAPLRGAHPGLVAFGLGLLSAAALPPMHALPVLWLSLPGLLFLLNRAEGWRAAARVAFCFGLGHHIAGLYWITEAILIEATTFWWLVPLGVPMLAAVLALFILLPCLLARLAPMRGRGWVLAGLWVLFDVARQFVLSGFPWNPLGSAWAVPGLVGDAMLQPASAMGVHGLTLLTLLAGFAPLGGRRGMTAVGVLLAAWAGWGAIRLGPNLPPSSPLTVVLVQGNIAQEGKWERERALRNFDRYLRLTREGIAMAGDGPTLVVWPETASPFLIDRDAEARAAVAEAAGGPAFIGTIRFDAARRPYNSLAAIDGPGPVAALYDKWHLVPFGEYQPGWFPLPIAFVSGDGFGRGPGPQTWRLPGIPAVGPMICYEAIFPAEGVAADRPEWLVNVTNDAWFGNSTGPRQHLAAARLRAVEEGLPVMRAANTGISAGFDGYGRELGRLGMNVAGSLPLTLPGALAPTVARRFGLWIPGILALIAIGAGLKIAHGTNHGSI